ncbi:metalloreductase STEAP4-like [Pundamilia nyererei]|uniref:Metalloreductase STEAP4-like n=1 Tax=Pundamilia nyererei TaxID=303518 RepID=A0A9Y3RDC9_9CICH|nr:PREDICTED: metalloreductase STEAP4-like [Pundamilia nyererei]
MKTEGAMLHQLASGDGPEPELMCIFGTGDLGRSLGLCLLQSGYRVVYGSRRPHSCGPLPEGAQVMTHEESARSAKMIFVCVHREHYEFLEKMAPQLERKVLVDLSNNLKKDMYMEANAVYLQRLVPKAAVVKGLNTLSTWALQNGLQAGRQVYLCGNNGEAKRDVAEMATKLGLTVVDKGSLSAAKEVEDFPLQLFPEWRMPLYVAFGLAAFFFLYLVIRDIIYAYVENDEDISYRIMISLANKITPVVSLIMLSLCYLPGAIAGFLQLYRGTKYRRFPNWLDRWMLCRKQLGLLALGFALLHAIYTLIIPARYSDRQRVISNVLNEVKKNTTTPLYFDNTSAWRTDSLYALGILGFFLFVLLGLTSLPSVGGTLSWREFSFVQSTLGYLTLFLSTAHCYIYAWDKFLRKSTYKWYTPPDSMLCLIVPSVTLVLKLVLVLPCVNRPLMRIRQGWERNRLKDEMGELKATNM